MRQLGLPNPYQLHELPITSPIINLQTSQSSFISFDTLPDRLVPQAEPLRAS